MTRYLLDSTPMPAISPAARDAALARLRHRHRTSCPDCDCEELVRATTAVQLFGLVDIDDIPVAITRTETPVVAVRFRTRATRQHKER